MLSKSPHVKYGVLDPLWFTNGALYFSDRGPQMLGVKPAVVQNNWITGLASKRHRFREHLLWYLDGKGYYEKPRKFLMYNNVQDPQMGIIHEEVALKNAFALSALLNRTLILPLFCLYHSVPG